MIGGHVFSSACENLAIFPSDVHRGAGGVRRGGSARHMLSMPVHGGVAITNANLAKHVAVAPSYAVFILNESDSWQACNPSVARSLWIRAGAGRL